MVSLALYGKDIFEPGVDNEEVVLAVFSSAGGTWTPHASALDHQPEVFRVSLQRLVQTLL